MTKALPVLEISAASALPGTRASPVIAVATLSPLAVTATFMVRSPIGDDRLTTQLPMNGPASAAATPDCATTVKGDAARTAATKREDTIDRKPMLCVLSSVI